MAYIQMVFFLAFAGIEFMAWRMWLLYREYRLPGVLWWVAGFSLVGLTALVLASSAYLGEWARAFLAHGLNAAGFGTVWLGMRYFLGERVGVVHYCLFAAILLLSIFGAWWFWIVVPMYQIRLTISCVVLLVLALAISQLLFSARIGQRVVTVAGLFYSLFAFINGLRTINILLDPALNDSLLSGRVALILTALMLPVLMAAQWATLRMVRDEVRPISEKGE